jgi:hypothetical protein
MCVAGGSVPAAVHLHVRPVGGVRADLPTPPTCTSPPPRPVQRVYAQSFFVGAEIQPLLPWISPWIFVGFLLSHPPYAQSFLRKPSFLVLADFFPWFFKSKQLLGFL